MEISSLVSVCQSWSKSSSFLSDDAFCQWWRTCQLVQPTNPLWIRLLCKPCTESQLTLVKEGLTFWWPKWGLFCYPNVRGWAGGLTHLEICVKPIKQPTNKQIMIHNTLKKKSALRLFALQLFVVECFLFEQMMISAWIDNLQKWCLVVICVPHPILTKKKKIHRTNQSCKVCLRKGQCGARSVSIVVWQPW